MNEEDKAVIKSVINEVLDKHGEKYCLPHEHRINDTEKAIIMVFSNGLKEKIENLKKSLDKNETAITTFKDAVEKKIEAISKRFWVIPVSIIVSIVGAYFLRYLFP